MDGEKFETLYQDFLEHAKGRELFVQDLVGGADVDHNLPTRIITENAWHSLFIRNLLIRPEISELANFDPEFTIIDFQISALIQSVMVAELKLSLPVISRANWF